MTCPSSCSMRWKRAPLLHLRYTQLVHSARPELSFHLVRPLGAAGEVNWRTPERWKMSGGGKRIPVSALYTSDKRLPARCFFAAARRLRRFIQTSTLMSMPAVGRIEWHDHAHERTLI